MKAKLRTRKPSPRVAENFATLGGAVVGMGADLRDLRVQQAQTETHLANTSGQLARLAEANARGYSTLLEHYNRLEQIVRAVAEGFATVQADIDQLQKFVGKQTELLAQIKAATVTVPLTEPEVEYRLHEARRMARASDV